MSKTQQMSKWSGYNCIENLDIFCVYVYVFMRAYIPTGMQIKIPMLYCLHWLVNCHKNRYMMARL